MARISIIGCAMSALAALALSSNSASAGTVTIHPSTPKVNVPTPTAKVPTVKNPNALVINPNALVNQGHAGGGVWFDPGAPVMVAPNGRKYPVTPTRTMTRPPQ